MTRPEVESAEAFASSIADTIEVLGGGVWSQSVSHTAETLALITARDAAIRAAALMTGLRERAAELRGRAAGPLDPKQRAFVEGEWERDAQAFDRYAQELIPCGTLATKGPSRDGEDWGKP